MSVTGIVEDVKWRAGEGGQYLDLGFSYSEILWPWSGYLAIRIKVDENGANFQGIAEGEVELTVRSPPRIGESSSRVSHLKIPLRVKIIPTPPPSRRILWDQFHSLSYPLGFYPHDIISLSDSTMTFDWNADHLHTNFREFYHALLELGFYVEILGDPLTCFNASNYGTLILMDSEEEFATEEKEKLRDDIANGLSVLVVADWYNSEVSKRIAFFDENTEKTWTPYTGLV